MNKIVKFLVWEAVLLTGVFFVKNYGKQCETYWDLFKEDCKDEELVSEKESGVKEESTKDVVQPKEETKVEKTEEKVEPVVIKKDSKPRTPRVKKVNPEVVDIKKSANTEKKPRTPRAKKTDKTSEE